MNRRDALCLVGTSVTGLALPGMRASAATGAGPAGAGLLQQFDTLFHSFHAAKKDPQAQVETSHYCMRLSADLFQCLVFHGPSSRLIGIEYIITDSFYRRLPLEEKPYWHPHTYEVLSGQLVAPDLPAEREKELLGTLVTTWGKTWQTWPDLATEVPEGEPLLMWSITRDGQLRLDVQEARDRRLHVSTSANRDQRQQLGHPVPQVEPPASLQEIGRPWSDAAASASEGRSRRRRV